MLHLGCLLQVIFLAGNIFGCSGLVLDLQACWAFALHRVAAPY